MFRLLMFALVALSSASAFAHSAPEILSITQSGNMMPGPGRTHHSIYSTIEIQYESCARFRDESFKVEVDSVQDDAKQTVTVSIDPLQMDCHGPSSVKTIKINRTNLNMLSSEVLVHRARALVPLKVTSHIAF